MSKQDVNGRAWDRFDAYLFDIDGTLLNCCDAVHYFAFCDALQTITGREMTLEGVTAHGNTDVGILRDALSLAGVEEGRWRPQLAKIRRTMGCFVAQREGELRVRVLPCVHEVLDHLMGQGAILGVATGNLQEIGKLKLKTAGLLEYFRVGGWSDEYEHRVDVFRGAIELIRAAAPENAAVCILGDTPADVHAAQINGVPIIAVCTGMYSREQLLEGRPDLCLQSFADLFQK